MTNHPNHTTMMLTTTQIATLLEHHGLGTLHNWRCLDTDTCPQSYVINGDIAIQINAHDPQSTTLRKEAYIYEHLAHANLPVPRLLALDVSHQIVPYDVVILERLEGRNALAVWPTLDADAQEQLSYAMGQSLATLHSQQFQRYGGYNNGTQQLGTNDNWRSYLLDKGADALISLWQCEGLPAILLYGAEEYLMRTIIPLRPTPTLVHGDFGLHNVLVARTGDGWRMSGLTNFRWSFVADAEYEFATGLMTETDEVNPLTSPFLLGYRSVRHLSDGWQQRSAVYRLIYHLTLCATVWQSFGGDPAMLRYHRGMIVDILKGGVSL